jgi:hypothetical protein
MNMMGRSPRIPPRLRARRAWRAWLGGALAGAAVVSAFILADRMIGQHQRDVITARRAAKEKLERMVMQYLRADVVDVRHTPEGNYRVTIYLENVYPEFDMFAMIPQVRAFAQSGPQWKEVESTDSPGARLVAGNVVNLKERITFDRIFVIPPDGDYFQLLPGFYHVQFLSPMLVSPTAEPKEDVAERTDNYYIHLRPVGADLAAIRRQNQFPGDIPIYLPMPPH